MCVWVVCVVCVYGAEHRRVHGGGCIGDAASPIPDAWPDPLFPWCEGVGGGVSMCGCVCVCVCVQVCVCVCVCVFVCVDNWYI